MTCPRTVAAALLLGCLLANGADAQGRRSPSERAKAYVERLGKGDLSSAKRDRYFGALKRLGKAAEGALASGWQGLGAEDAGRALELLAGLRTKRGEKAALLAVGDIRPPVRLAAARALGALPPSRKTLAGLGDLCGDSEREVVLCALGGLQSSASSEALAALVEVIRQHAVENFPRGAASTALAAQLSRRFTIARVEKVLEACRAVDDGDVRRTLFAGLTECRKRSVVPYLVRGLETCVPARGREPLELDAPPRLVSSATEAFAAGNRLVPLPEDLAALAARALGEKRDPKTFPLLMRCLKSGGPELRLASLSVIDFTTPSAAANDELIEAMILRLSDRSRQVRGAAYGWLRRTTGQRISQSFSLWRDWHEKAKQRALEEAVAAVAEEEGYDSVEDLLERGGYQFVEDYLADGGREKVNAYLDRKHKQRRPVGPPRGGEVPR